MLDVNEFGTGQYLNAKKLGELGTTLEVTIQQAYAEMVRDPKAGTEERKLVISFDPRDSLDPLILNKTNRGTLAALFGRDAEQ